MILKNDTFFKESLEGLGLIEDSGAFLSGGPWGAPGACAAFFVGALGGSSAVAKAWVMLKSHGNSGGLFFMILLFVSSFWRCSREGPNVSFGAKEGPGTPSEFLDDEFGGIISE